MINISAFIGCALIIFFAGRKLSWYGDLIAEKMGWGKVWIGLILMASVTSLPELVVGISASAMVKSADLAVGDVLGSCTFNLAILAILDIFVPRKEHLFFVASTRHILSAALGMILVALAGIGLFLPKQISVMPGIGVFSIAFLIIYLLSIRLIYKFEINSKTEQQLSHPNGGKSLKKLSIYYTLFALVIIGAALLVPFFAEKIADQTGLGSPFVGTVFVAISTSMPEIAVSIAAVRFGSIDMAVANLLGSNIFNILILVVDDVFYPGGILLKDASDIHLISVFSSLIMTAIAIAGFTYRAPNKKFIMAIDSLLILGFYVINLLLLYILK